MTKNTTLLLSELGFSSKQTEIFILLYQYGAKPASTISKIINVERTNTYKLIQNMVSSGIIAETKKNGIKHFFIEDIHVLQKHIDNKKNELHEKEKKIPQVEIELNELSTYNQSSLPLMRFYEGKQGMAALFDDLYNNIIDKNYMSIRFFGSNTLESQSGSSFTINKWSNGFFNRLKEKKIHVDAYIGNGIMILEHLIKNPEGELLSDLPAGNGAINVFLCGDIVYVIIYKEIPFGLKIESKELSGLFYFLLKKTN